MDSTPSPNVFQVVDDAVKIGLGAVIAGVFAWLVARHNNRSAILKLKFEKKTQILSEAAKIHEEHFQAFYKYTLALVVIDAERNKKMSTDRAQEIHGQLLAHLLQEATGQRLQMAQKIPATIYVQSQLMLLGEHAAVAKSRTLVDIIGQADESFRFNGTGVFDVSKFDEVSKRVGRAREEFFKQLETVYNKM